MTKRGDERVTGIYKRSLNSDTTQTSRKKPPSEISDTGATATFLKSHTGIDNYTPI